VQRRRGLIIVLLGLTAVLAFAAAGGIVAAPQPTQADIGPGDVGYEIVRLEPISDTVISKQYPSNNYGDDWTLTLRSGDQAAALFGFDVGELEARGDLAVAQAVLHLYVQTKSNTAGVIVNGCAVLKPWLEEEASWLFATDEQRWQSPGCNGSTDRESECGPETVIAEESVWVEVDVTDIVARWVSGELKNEGVVLKVVSGGRVTAGITSREHSNAALHPVLEVAMAVLPTPVPTLPPPHMVDIAKTGPPGPFSVGVYQTITYDIVARNTGVMTLTNVVITDFLPLGTEYIDATGGGVYSPSGSEGGIVTWSIDTLPVGVTETVQIDLGLPTWVKEQGNIVNLVRANCVECESVSEDYWEIAVLVPTLVPPTPTTTPTVPTVTPTPTGPAPTLHKMYFVEVYERS